MWIQVPKNIQKKIDNIQKTHLLHICDFMMLKAQFIHGVLCHAKNTGE